MEPVWYFMSRATGTLIPLLLISFGAGVWMGWIKWHTWKKEYNEVERDYHKLHDIHDAARQTIPELEARRAALTDEIGNLEELLGKFKEANESYEAESRRLNETLRATKRNYEAMEEVWRGKITQAEIRIIALENALERRVKGATSPVAHLPELPMETLPGLEMEISADAGRLIPFPAPETVSGLILQDDMDQLNKSAARVAATNAKNRKAI